MKQLLQLITRCEVCKNQLPHPPRPVVSATKKSKILVIGQAPGSKVHASGIPWDDASGRTLRHWLGVDTETFYNPDKFGIVPMGFCYPGKGKSGDLPPRSECAPLWHHQLLEKMTDVKLTLLIGAYAQKYYLKENFKNNLTETVRNYKHYAPTYIPLPHPSPRNNIWLKKNDWFSEELLPVLRSVVLRINV